MEPLPRIGISPRPAPESKIPVPDATPTVRSIKGKCYVIDGDTITISGTKIRTGGIDAPELNHPYGKVSKSALIKMCKGKIVTAVIKEEMSYDRIVATCYLPDGRTWPANLSKTVWRWIGPGFSVAHIHIWSLRARARSYGGRTRNRTGGWATWSDTTPIERSMCR